MANEMNVQTIGVRPGPPVGDGDHDLIPAVGEEFDSMKWLNGVTFRSFGCAKAVGAAVDPCDDKRTTNITGSFGSFLSFDPFLAEYTVSCSAVSSSAEEVQEEAIAHSAQSMTAIIGEELMLTNLSTNAGLLSAAQIITAVDTTPMGALASVEDALADLLDGGVGMIHVSPGALIRLNSGGGLQFVDGLWRTPTGHVIVADPGYAGWSPSTGTVISGQTWIYGSGPVMLKYSAPVVVGTAVEAFNYKRNMMNAQVEQYALVFFDTCSVVAARINFP